jgi:hypothetical protein
MKKIILTIAIIFFALITLKSQTETPPALGDGTADNPYQISTLENLYWMRQNTAQWGSGFHYIQTNDIDASETQSWGNNGWNPIGNNTTPWEGIYNGQGYTISGLLIRRTNQDYMGFFGVVENSTIKNLGLTNVNINGRQYTGGLSGRNISSTIDSCFTTGSVTGTSYVGGLSGANFATNIRFSYSNCNITGEQHVGGLLGSTSQSQVRNSFSTGNVRGNSNVGGFVGWNAASNDTRLCYSHGRVTRITGTHSAIGSFAGYNTSGIIYSYSTGRVLYANATNPTDKGFVGTNSSGTYDRNFFDSNLSGQSTGTGATARTTAQMMLPGNYTGWNFITTWTMVEGEYPILLGHDIEALEPMGAGTLEEPYLMETLENIFWLSQNPGTWDKHFLQTQHIDATPTLQWLDGRGLKPIGNSVTRFSGSYIGQGFTIDGLYINRPSTSSVGFFGEINGGVIRDLGITNANISGHTQVGALVGSHGMTAGNNTLIEFCYTTGQVYGNNWVGGMAGYVRNAQLANNYSFCDVIRLSESNTSLGAFVGYNQTVILTNNYSIGNIFFNNAAHPTDKGFIGSEQNENTYTGNYFDSEHSNQSTSLGATARTTLQMKEPATFTGWDFGTWLIEPDVNKGYPYLLPYRAQLETLPVTNITSNEAQSGGKIINDHGLEVTQKGMVWNTSTNPTIENNSGITLEEGEGDEFTSIMTGLEPGTAYFVRPYAITERGVAYGEQLSFTTTPEGSGTEEDPFRIATLKQLKWLADNDLHWDKHFIQVADIDAADTQNWNEGAGWQTIGYYIAWNNLKPFTGRYNGQNHKISNLHINQPALDYKGLFGYALDAHIKNLVLEDLRITARDYLGSLVGLANGCEIENIVVISTIVNGRTALGGLIGSNSNSTSIRSSQTSGSINGSGNSVGGVTGLSNFSTIESCHSTCAVTGISNVGGLVGRNFSNSLIINSSSTSGLITGNSKIGGLVGSNESSSIENSFRTGDIISSVSSNNTEMGGLVGANTNNSTIRDSWASDGKLHRTGGHANHYSISQGGGLAGFNHNSTIINCYSTFQVDHTNTSAGGLVGHNDNGLIVRSYAKGSVRGTANLGGLVGLNNNSSVITDCYSRGSIIIKEAFAYSQFSQGGLVGSNSSAAIYNSYATGSINYEQWGMTSSASKGLVGSDNQGIYNGNYFRLSSNQTSSVGASGLTSDQMKTMESFEGWDFEGIWGFEVNINDDFPVIDAQTIPVVITTGISDISQFEATTTATVTLENLSSVKARGFVWSDLPNPTIETNVGLSTEGDGTGSFISFLENLLPGTTYYIKAWAENSTGVTYGTQLIFTTEAGEPQLSTKDITQITQTTAQSGGIIISDGGADVTERGIVWSTSENPSIETHEGITTDGEGQGEFESQITGMNPGTMYFVRAYAINVIDTAYGEQKSLITLPQTATFTLSLSASPAEGGTVSLEPEQQEGPYQEGVLINIVATANAGYEFVEWTQNGESISTDQAIEFEMPASDTELVAVFSEITSVVYYNLELLADPDEHGSVALGHDQPEGPFTMGENVTVVAIPGVNSVFMNWVVNNQVVSMEPSFEFTMPGHDVILTAIFSPKVNTGPELLQTLTLYPNPFNDYIYFSGGTEIRKITITNMAGQKVWEGSDLENGFMNTGSLLSGIYLVSVEYKNEVKKVYRMVKNK